MPFVTLKLPAPVVAAHGIVAVSEVSLWILNGADAPLMVTFVIAGFWKFVPVRVTTVPRTPDVGLTAVTVGCTAHAGTAVTSTPTTPRARASAVARDVTFFFGNLIEASSFLGVGAGADGRHVPSLRP